MPRRTPPPTAAPLAPATELPPEPGRHFPIHTVICAGLVVAAELIMGRLLAAPVDGVLALNPADQAMFEWMLALGPRFYTGDLDLVTGLLNAPEGVNLLSNTSILAISLIMAPVTATAGAAVSFALVSFLNLAGTAVAFYLLFARALRLHPAGAALGAAMAAFGPGTVSQANGHLHMTAQWLVPVLVWCVLRLARTDDSVLPPGGRVRRVVGTGALLGAGVSLQVFVGEEILLLTVVTLAVFCAAYATLSPARARKAAGPLAGGLAVGAGVALAALAYPLWLQFAGPQHVSEAPFAREFFGADLAGMTAFSPLSVGGSAAAGRLASGPAEYTTFFGPVLIPAVLAAAVWLRRRPAVLAAVITGALLLVISAGTQLIVDGARNANSTPPLAWLLGLPVLDQTIPARFALPLLALFGFVVATAADRALRTDHRLIRVGVPTLIVLTLLPLVPKQLPVIERPPVPRFFTTGHWRSCVEPGGTLVPIPLRSVNLDEMRWAAAADAAFAEPEGFFIGPYGQDGGATFGTRSRPTSQLLADVERTGTVPPIGDQERADFNQDVAFWHATCFVMMPALQTYPGQLDAAMNELLGPGDHVDDVIVWRVTP